MILLLLLSTGLSAQKKQDSLATFHPAYVAYQFTADGKYDSAVYYFNKELEIHPDTSDIYWMYKYKIADCLVKLGKAQKAKIIYLNCFKRIEAEKNKRWQYLVLDDETTNSIRFTFICLELADIYIAEKKYDSALYFINWNRLYWPERQLDGATHKYEKAIKAAYQYALCFYAKKQIDSAITHLANYAFYKNVDIHQTLDSAKYDKLVKLYFKLLKKRCSASEIKDSFFYAINNMSYRDTCYQILPGEDEKHRWHFIASYLMFFGNRVDLLIGNYKSDPLDDSQAKRSSKEYILNDLKNTEIYKLIAKLN